MLSIDRQLSACVGGREFIKEYRGGEQSGENAHPAMILFLPRDMKDFLITGV